MGDWASLKDICNLFGIFTPMQGFGLAAATAVRSPCMVVAVLTGLLLVLVLLLLVVVFRMLARLTPSCGFRSSLVANDRLSVRLWGQAITTAIGP